MPSDKDETFVRVKVNFPRFISSLAADTTGKFLLAACGNNSCRLMDFRTVRTAGVEPAAPR
jgi:hypothetical protein